MISSDTVTGRLNWNTSIVDESTYREARGKGPKPKMFDTDVTVGKKKNPTGDLDTLISSMQASENIPGSGMKSKTENPKKKKADLVSQFDRLAMKYKTRKAKATGTSARGDGVTARGDGDIKPKRKYTRRVKKIN